MDRPTGGHGPRSGVVATTGVTGRLQLAANSVTLVALLLLGGALGDRGPRRRLLVITNLAAAGTQATVAVLRISGHVSVSTRCGPARTA